MAWSVLAWPAQLGGPSKRPWASCAAFSAADDKYWNNSLSLQWSSLSRVLRLRFCTVKTGSDWIGLRKRFKEGSQVYL